MTVQEFEIHVMAGWLAVVNSILSPTSTDLIFLIGPTATMGDFEPLHTGFNETEQGQEQISREMFEMVFDASDLFGPLSAARFELVDKLERIDESKLGSLMNEHCSICYNTFAAIVAEEEMIQAMDTPVSERELGVTKLQKCGHYFCRKDISKWILEGNDKCPYCRKPFLSQPAGSATRASDAANGAPQGANAEPFSANNDSSRLGARLLLEGWEAAAGADRGSQRPLRSSLNSMYS